MLVLYLYKKYKQKKKEIMTQTAIRFMMASVALSTTVGVFMHDSHIDAATITALTAREKNDKDVNGKLTPELHTHAEHLKIKKSTGGRSTSPDPRDQLRNRQKKMSPKLSKSGMPAHVQHS